MKPRIHLLSHANTPARDIERFGFASSREYLAFIRAHMPPEIRLTFSRRIFDAVEEPLRGGRTDDALRVRDLQNAISDPATAAIIACNGGAWMTRILPHLDFSPLDRRTTPLLAMGFSEITGLVNLVAARRMGRGVYWLCPNYLAWKVKPPAAARAAFGEFWRGLAAHVLGTTPAPVAGTAIWSSAPIDAKLRSGRVSNGTKIEVVGGCLSVLAALLPGALMRRVRPDRRWLAIEDVNEQEHRIDRHLAALKIAGLFERIAGVLVGDFHIEGRDQSDAVLQMLRYHIPSGSRIPIATTRHVGHIWPMRPLPLMTPMSVKVRGRALTLYVEARRGGDQPAWRR